tara:strand:- start:390 stop:584 length:195 start_codon:yes stop_codon:yes gene_type:complete
MQIGPTLFSYMPLDNVSQKKQVIEQTVAAVEKRVSKQKTESTYAYHPINKNLPQQGTVKDFVIA